MTQPACAAAARVVTCGRPGGRPDGCRSPHCPRWLPMLEQRRRRRERTQEVPRNWRGRPSLREWGAYPCTYHVWKGGVTRRVSPVLKATCHKRGGFVLGWGAAMSQCHVPSSVESRREQNVFMSVIRLIIRVSAREQKSRPTKRRDERAEGKHGETS